MLQAPAMSKPKAKPAPVRPRGRPPGETPPPGVTGVRIPPSELAAIDAWVDDLNRTNTSMRATRSSVLLDVIRKALASERGWTQPPKGKADA